ncbi:ABC transporter permease [Aureimonas sp. AU40]|uniref:ABC transporter permease n=1 Tax=Aureimonas sp. AU40 TaxID=1637747 RepID=UPI0009E8644B|nr:ABC transporter permease [Aureimonas sp. AU40]
MRSSILASATAERAGSAWRQLNRAGQATAELLATLRGDRAALAGALFLLLALAATLFAPPILADEARRIDLAMRNAQPFDPNLPWRYLLGADSLGRSILFRLLVATRNTLLIAGTATLGAAIAGTLLGIVAGYRDGAISTFLLRLADAIMSFPSMLLAVLVLFVFEPGILNVVAVLAVSRLPIFLRTVRAEVLEIRQRLFVVSAQAMGAGRTRIVLKHILPMVMPTVVTLTALEMAFVMLLESGLSFLGIGIQPPEITWGLMVAGGRNYIGSAWWVAFWPGLAIFLVAAALNLVANWLRTALDPAERWRLGSSLEVS